MPPKQQQLQESSPVGSDSSSSSSLSQTVLTAALAGTFAYYIYISLRQTAREITPRPFSQNNDAVLSLINFDAEDAEQLALILPSWTGVIQHAEIADVVLYPDDSVNSDIQHVQSDARQGFHTIQAHHRSEQFGQRKTEDTTRPATLAMKTTVEIAGTPSLDVLLSPIELAKKVGGKLMDVNCIIALCTGPDDADVDVFTKTVSGKVCNDVKFLEELAAVRKGNSSNTSSSSTNNNTCFSASNYLTLEDLFEPYDDFNAALLLDEREDEWYKVFSKYISKENSNNESFVQLWRKAKIQAEIVKQQHNHQPQQHLTIMSSLLVSPWKYRTYIELAHFLMYGQSERKFGSLFSGFGRGLAHGANALKRFFSFSNTGSLSETFKKAVSKTSSSDNNNNNTSLLPQKGSFSQLCNSDFGYNSDNALCGRFEVHITVRMTQQSDVDAFKTFADRIGLKIVQIELPAGQHPTQLMTSFYMQGTVERCTSGAWDFASQLFLLTGLEVLRIKLELQVHDVRNAAALMKFANNNNNENNTSSSNNSNNTLLRPFLLLNGPGLGLCPVRDQEAQNRKFMTPTQYFEFHIKLCIPGEIREGVLKKVKEVCNKYDAHLSKNAFKPSQSNNSPSVSSPVAPSSAQSSSSAFASVSSSLPASPNSEAVIVIDSNESTTTTTNTNNQQQHHTYFYFVTLRIYELGLYSSLDKLDALKNALETVLDDNSFEVVNANENGNTNAAVVVKPTIHSIQREFAVFDSSAALDKGWIDMRTTSNAHEF